MIKLLLLQLRLRLRHAYTYDDDDDDFYDYHSLCSAVGVLCCIAMQASIGQTFLKPCILFCTLWIVTILKRLTCSMSLLPETGRSGLGLLWLPLTGPG